MCEYSAENGFANNWHLVHLGSRAVGGAGLIITEATAVSAEGRISPRRSRYMGRRTCREPPQYHTVYTGTGLCSGYTAGTCRSKIQYLHPWKGSKVVPPEEGGWKEIYAPSAIPFSEHYGMPIALSIDGIKKGSSRF